MVILHCEVRLKKPRLFSCLLFRLSCGCKFMTLKEGFGGLDFGDILGSTVKGNLKINFFIFACYFIIT